MIPISLLNLAGLIQADPPPFMKPQLPRVEIPKIDPLPPIAPEPLPKPPVSLLWRKLLGYVPVVRAYYAGQAIAEFLDDARDMYDDIMALEAERSDHDNFLKGAETYRADLAESNDPEAEKKRQWEATCYWNCVDRNGAGYCLKPSFVQEESRPKRDTFGEPVRKSDEEVTLTPAPATVQNGPTGVPKIVASADDPPVTPATPPVVVSVAEDQGNGSIGEIVLTGLMSIIDLIKGMRAEGMSADLIGLAVSRLIEGLTERIHDFEEEAREVADSAIQQIIFDGLDQQTLVVRAQEQMGTFNVKQAAEVADRIAPWIDESKRIQVLHEFQRRMTKALNVPKGFNPVSDPTDWQQVAKMGPMQFIYAVEMFSKWARQTVLRMIDDGASGAEISAWRKSLLVVERDKMRAARESIDIKGFDVLWHDAVHGINELSALCEVFAMQPDGLLLIRLAILPPEEGLRGFLQSLIHHFRAQGSVVVDVPANVELSKSADRISFARILENIIRNSFAHSRPGVANDVTISLSGNTVTISDKGTGMSDQVKANLLNGVRVHDGVRVDGGDRGLGWVSIRNLCERLKIKIDIETKLGAGTKVILTLPDGFFQ